MRTNLWRLTSIVILLAMLISPAGAASSAFAAPLDKQPAVLKPGMQVIDASFVGESQPLSSLAPIKVEASAATMARSQQARLGFPKTESSQSNGGFDASIVQNGPTGISMPAPVANFEGVNNVNGVLPPDTQGDIGNDPGTGKKYYIQWVNLSFQIWDVTAPAAQVSVYGPAAGNTLWAGTGTVCASYNDGDPITQFDHLANRWMMSQFALPSYPNGPFYQCIAVSATADPTGAWYLYQFETSATLMNDYPKFGVWPDGYYMTVNQFGSDPTCTASGWCGAGVGVFERTAMLAGLPARLIYFDTGPVSANQYGGMLPSDLDGPAPADGTPNYFMEWDDSTWLGDAADTLRVWEFKTDWATPANTTFGLNANFDPNLKITTANVDPDMCAGARNCIPQPGTTQGLDAIADRLMYRLQYRDFGSYQTLVGNHTVDATSADKAGIHWFELRDTGTGFAMNQEGVYTSGSDNVWMGSAAMDASGDIALGYSVSSGTTYPSVRYTGRLDADPANTLPQGEAILIAGTGSQTHTAARWGDYSMMAVDDADGCTFWYTQEYIQTTGNAPWQTRVGSFKFPSCTTEPTGVLSGTVTDSASAPLAGATVEASGGYTTVTDAAGNYSLTLVAGTYSVTASKYGYVSSNAPAVVVTPPGTTTQDFTLAAAPSSTISGVVTDATTGWPLYASIDIYGYPSSPVFTDPVTGAYSVPLVDGSYTFTVSAMSGGYTPTVLPLVVAGDATQDFALAADLIACTAPGYAVTPPAFSENFETWPLAGWTIVDNEGLGTVWDSNTNWGDPNWTGGTGMSADVNDDTAANEFDTELITPVITTASLPSYSLTYLANYSNYLALDFLNLDINVDSGGWVNVLSWNEDHGTFQGTPGETVAIDLTPFVTGSTSFQLRWHYYDPNLGDWDWYAQIDDVSLGAGCSPMPSSGLVVGAVKDINADLLLANATVEDAALNQALFIDNSADTSENSPLYIIAEPAGVVTLTASAPLYADDVAFPTVVAGSVVRQDFGLDAGMLSIAPASLFFHTITTASKPATLSNTGGASANYQIFAIPGVFAGYTPTGPFAAHTRHTGPKNLNDVNTDKLSLPSIPPTVPALDGGTISTSWPTGLTYAWGLGFNTDANDLWLGNILAGGGDNLDYRFTTAGVNTGDTIDTAPWVGSFGGDMTYNPFTKTLWQVNVGGDNCIYELDPASMLSTGNNICPAFGTSERGLAFDPLTNTYYAGSWNDAIINHFAPDGTMLASVDVGLDIAGLAFNPSTGHLFVMVSATGQPDIYVLDTNTPNYDIVGAFYLHDGTTKVFAAGGQAGLDIDCTGNLWAVNQTTQEVYVADSGETGVCDWQASWLSVTPATGSVAAAGNAPLTVTADATGLTAGATYQAYLRVVSDTPYSDETLPVTLTVTGSPIFSDVPTSYWANDFIERLYLAGITTGCGTSPLIYCPEANVTRAEMAVFLLRGEHGAAYVPPAVGTDTGFTDVPTTYWAAAWIKQLAVEGITTGCSATTYCPDSNVTRAQMAIFLLRGEHGAAYVPPAVGTDTGFTDVPTTYWAASWIKQLAVEGITAGCSPTDFCPDSNVTRAEMAVFLVRTFNLP